MCADKGRKRQLLKTSGFITALFLVLLVFSPLNKAEAASSISVKEINYFSNTITLQLNNADTKVYLSDSKMKTWEQIPGTITNSNTLTMDISWIRAGKNYVMKFKGNASTGILTVTIPKQVTNFKVKYNKVKGTFTFKNVGSRIIQWRKKTSTLWNTVDTNTISDELAPLSNKGAAVYFRLAPVNGTSASKAGSRPSKEIAITISKKTSAPSIEIDGSAFCIAVKKGMAYRTVYSDETASDWTTIRSNSDLLLKNVASNALYSGNSTGQAEVVLQFRKNSTSSSQVSKITTVTVPVQEGAPGLDTYGISLGYTSSTTLSLQVKAASTTVPFEYIVIDENDGLNYQTAEWTSITSSTAISLDDDAVEEGSHIYVRKKSIGSIGDEDFSLASYETDISSTVGVSYPDSPLPSTLTTLITTAGVCKTDKSSSYLIFTLYSATSTTVSSIEFLDTYGIEKGSVTCKSTVAKNSGSTGTSDKYIITTKITSTESIDSVTEETLYAKITLANSDVITSTSSAGVLLYLYPETVVNNPDKDDDDEYTSSFQRMYQSNDSNDDQSFKFCLDLGTQNVIDNSAVDKYTATATAISSMKYDGYTLNAGSDYTVEYGSYTEEDKTIATATVTVNVAEFEEASLIDDTDKAVPLEIYLNNGEILDEDVYITLINTATLDDAPLAWSITESSLKETTTTTTTNSDNSTTTVNEKVITYTLKLSLYSNSYAVSIADVTWGGISIFDSANISNGKATIYLSNAKINKLTTTSTTTNNIVITLSNGFAIKTGCKLTILDASE